MVFEKNHLIYLRKNFIKKFDELQFIFFVIFNIICLINIDVYCQNINSNQNDLFHRGNFKNNKTIGIVERKVFLGNELICNYSIQNLQLRFARINSNYLPKVQPGTKKKIWGMVLTSVGTTLLPTGVFLLANADSYSYSAGYSSSGGSYSSGDLGGALGVLSIPASAALLISGLYLWTSGPKWFERPPRIPREQIVSKPKKDMKGNPFHKFLHIQYGVSKLLGKEFSSVYGRSNHFGVGMALGLFKNRIKLGPDYEYCWAKKIFETIGEYTKERFMQFKIGPTLGYLRPINSAKSNFINPSISIFYSKFNDEILSDEKKYYLFYGQGISVDSRLDFIFHKLKVGVTFSAFKPESEISGDFERKYTVDNDIYQVNIINKETYQFNFSSIGLSFGVVF